MVRGPQAAAHYTRPGRTQECPPSTGKHTPVMKRASSEARNTAALAISQGEPVVFIGTAALRAATISSTEEYCADICR